ncbi:MAG: HAD-IIB family hydrolase [Clostridium sp.]|nr:HAD-IIB family hydrolase [Clostridium sp.]
MGKFDGVLLVSDYDDTFLGTNRAVSPRNYEALRYYLGQGGLFTIATGRAHRTFAPHVHLAPVNAPVILSNGSALYDFQKDEMLLQTMLPDTCLEDLTDVLTRFPTLGAEFYHGEDIYVHNPNYITEAHMKKVGTEYEICPVPQVPRPWTKIILQEENPVQRRVQQYILDTYGDEYEAVFSNHYYLEITRKGSTKGGMVDEVVKRLNLDPKKVYCVGDNQNDIPMLARSAIPFAPSNCAQEVKDWGARLVCSCDEGVVADIVEILDTIY